MLDAKLSTLLSVVKTGSYTAAAEELHMTQPAITHHIQKLEEHYGCKLFVKEGRCMTLTSEGELLVHYTNLQFTNEKHLMKALNRKQKPFKIGSTLSIADYYLPPILTKYLNDENIMCEIVVHNTKTLLRDLLNGELDGAFIEGIFDQNLFESYTFYHANLVPIVSANHILANAEITLDELYEYPLILREKGSGTRAVLENYLAQQNTTIESFDKICEIGSFILIKRLLEESNGISFVYEAVAEREIAEGTLAKVFVKGYRNSHEFHFVYLKNGLNQYHIIEFYEKLISYQSY